MNLEDLKLKDLEGLGINATTLARHFHAGADVDASVLKKALRGAGGGSEPPVNRETELSRLLVLAHRCQTAEGRIRLKAMRRQRGWGNIIGGIRRAQATLAAQSVNGEGGDDG